MASSPELDIFTKRPRTPNDPYTFMSDEQIENNRKVSFTLKLVYYCNVLCFKALKIGYSSVLKFFNHNID